MHDVRIQLNPRPTDAAERDAVLERPVFGQSFGDHMVTMAWQDGGWGPLELVPFGPLQLSPATLALHYGQSIFEALKAYRAPDDSVSLFRPSTNAARFAISASRLAMPTLPEGVFELACALLASADRDWIPSGHGAALYVRPFLFASEAHLSVRPAREYRFVVIASPVASYFGDHLPAISVAVETADVRATPGGTGAVKFAGNYAAGFAAHGRAGDAGHDQVLWLDATERRWVEELNAMNVVFVWDRDGRTVVTTPPLTGTILEGVTRSSLLQLAADAADAADAAIAATGEQFGDGERIDEVREEPTAIEQVWSGLADGTLREVFACGTAAVVVPIGSLVADGEPRRVGDGQPGPVTAALRRRLLGVQHGTDPDFHGWLAPVERLLVDGGVDPARLGR